MLDISSKTKGALRQFEYASVAASVKIMTGTMVGLEDWEGSGVDIVDHAAGWFERNSLQPTTQNRNDQFKRLKIERHRPITHTDSTSSELTPACPNERTITPSTIPRPPNEMGMMVAKTATAIVPVSTKTGIEMPNERNMT